MENFHTLKYTINSFVGYDNIPFRCIVPHRLVFYSRSAGSWFRILNFNEIISANLFVGKGAIRQQSAKIPAYGTENVGESDIDWRGFASLNWICRETKRCAAREEPRAAFRLATYVRTFVWASELLVWCALRWCSKMGRTGTHQIWGFVKHKKVEKTCLRDILLRTQIFWAHANGRTTEGFSKNIKTC